MPRFPQPNTGDQIRRGFRRATLAVHPEWMNGRTLERKANWQPDKGVEERDGVGGTLGGVAVAWKLLSRRR